MLSKRIYFFLLIAPLGYALFSQYVQGYHPCEMCIYQRWGYVGAILFCIASLKYRKLFKLSLLFLVLTCATAFFHVGLEQKWWEGFSTCSGAAEKGASLEELKNMILAAPAVKCDEISWTFLSLSMAAWNAIYTFCLSVYGYILCQRKYI